MSNEDVTQQDELFQCIERRRFILGGNFQVFGTKGDLNQRKLFIIYKTVSSWLSSVILYWKALASQIISKNVNETCSLALTLVLPLWMRLAERSTLFCLGLLTAFPCGFSLYKPHFRPVHFFLIFLFPKTKKQNTLAKIKTHVHEGCAIFILWLCHSPAAFLFAPKRAGEEENLAVFCAHHPSSLTLVSW